MTTPERLRGLADELRAVRPHIPVRLDDLLDEVEGEIRRAAHMIEGMLAQSGPPDSLSPTGFSLIATDMLR